MTPVEIIQALLQGATDQAVVNRFVAPDADYVSLSFSNPDLRKVMPWAGTHVDGRQGIVSTFRDVNRWWKINMKPKNIFGDSESAAVFGEFTLTSVTTNKTFTSPFAVFIKVRNEKVVHMQYLEDTFGTASTFRTGGEWTFGGDPNGSTIAV